MKQARFILRVVAAMLLMVVCGCLDLDHTLVLHADGSGHLAVSTVYSAIAVQALSGRDRFPAPFELFKPRHFPQTQAEADALAVELGTELQGFRGVDLDDGRRRVEYTLVFRDVKVFASRAQRFFSITMRPEQHAAGQSVIRAEVRGIGMPALAETWGRAQKRNRRADDLALARNYVRDARYRLAVRVPQAPIKSNATETKDREMVWIFAADQVAELDLAAVKRKFPKAALPAQSFAFDLPVLPSAGVGNVIPAAEEISFELRRVAVLQPSPMGRQHAAAVQIEGDLVLPPSAQPLAMQLPERIQTRTLAGEDIRHRSPRRPVWRPFPEGARVRVPVRLPPLPVSSTEIQSLLELKAVLPLQFAGPTRMVKIPDLASWNDKVLNPEQMGDLKVRVKQVEPAGILLMVIRARSHEIRDWRFLDAAGNPLSVPAPQIETLGNYTRIIFPTFRPPPNTTLQLQRVIVKEVEFPLKLPVVPIPK